MLSMTMFTSYVTMLFLQQESLFPYKGTLNPDTRSLLKVSQISDDDYSIFDTLMGEDVEKRRDFIISSANTIDHVDI